MQQKNNEGSVEAWVSYVIDEEIIIFSTKGYYLCQKTTNKPPCKNEVG